MCPLFDPAAFGCLVCDDAYFLLSCSDLYSVASGVLYVSSVLLVLYATESVHRLPYVVAANLLVLSVPVAILLLFTRTPSGGTTEPDDKKTK